MLEIAKREFNLFQFKPVVDHDEKIDVCFENYLLLVKKAKRLRFEKDWNADTWNVTGLNRKRTSIRGKKSLVFGIRQDTKGNYTYFNKEFSDLVKSIITVKYIERGIGHGPLHTLLIAFRYLYNALDKNKNWKDLDLDTFIRACETMKSREALSTCYRMGGRLKEISNYLSRFGLVPVPIDFQSPFKRTSNSDPLSKRFIERKSKLFLDEGVINAILKLDKMTLPEEDRLVVLIFKMLLFTGFRISELLALKWNSLVKKIENGEQFIGLRYYPLKGAHAKGQIRWFGDLSGHLVGECFEEIANITKKYRKIGKWILQNPGKTYLRKLTTLNEIRLIELSDLLSTSCSSISTKLSKNGLKSPFKIEDLEKIYVDNNVVPVFEDRRTGYKVDISEALFVIPVYYFSQIKISSRVLVSGISHSMFENITKTKGSSLGLFDRYNLKDSRGRKINLSSHMFRRFLNTLYNEGGVPLTVLTKAFGRKSRKDTLSYLYTSAAERTKKIQQEFECGAMIGPKADFIQEIPVKERSEYIDALASSVHYLGHGYCSHDWSSLPCEKQLNCTDNCIDFHVRKDDPNSLNYLKQQKRWAEDGIRSAKNEVDDKTYGAQAHLDHYRRILKTTEKYLKKIEDESEEKKNDGHRYSNGHRRNSSMGKL